MILTAEDMLTPDEAGKKYRTRPSTIRSLCRLGKIRHIVRSGRGPTGFVTLIYPDSAERVLGIPQ
jgi:hypothetical protein